MGEQGKYIFNPIKKDLERRTVLEKFNTCSYGELTTCIRGRLNDIREYKRFLMNQECKFYPRIAAHIRFDIAFEKYEIRCLLKMRRVLKRSGLKSWDSTRLSI